MKILLCFFILLLLLAFAPVRADDPLTDARLLGTWKSNRDVTVEALRPHLKMPPKAQTLLFSIFGRLKLTFAGDKLSTEMPSIDKPEEEPYRSTQTYKVTAVTADTVTTRARDEKTGSETQVTFHFVSPDRFWIKIPQNDRLKEIDMSEWKEFFDRVNK